MADLEAIRQIIDAYYAITEPIGPGTTITHPGPVRRVHFV
jgi:hypothetical protein